MDTILKLVDFFSTGASHIFSGASQLVQQIIFLLGLAALLALVTWPRRRAISEWLSANVVWRFRLAPAQAAALPATGAVLAPSDWWIDGIFYIVHGRWLGQDEEAIPTADQRQQAAELFFDVRQRARSGALTIWGRSWESGTWNPIPAGYWEDHEVDPVELFRTEQPEYSETSAATPDGKGPFYKAIKINRQQFESLWPPKRQ